MRHNHLLLNHPLFEEKPIQEVLEPFGFEVSVDYHEPPCCIEQPEEADAYARDSIAYIDTLSFEHPADFTEVYRGDNEDSEIFSVAVRATTPFAAALLYADPACCEGPEITLADWQAIAERVRQIKVEGWTPEHDDEHDDGTLAAAAASYALNAADQLHPHSQGDGRNAVPVMWPWAPEWWKPTNPPRDLAKSIALGLAELERLERAAAKLSEGEIPVDASDAGGAA